MKHAWQSKFPEVATGFATKGLLLQAIRLAVAKRQQARRDKLQAGPRVQRDSRVGPRE